MFLKSAVLTKYLLLKHSNIRFTIGSSCILSSTFTNSILHSISNFFLSPLKLHLSSTDAWLSKSLWTRWTMYWVVINLYTILINIFCLWIFYNGGKFSSDNIPLSNSLVMSLRMLFMETKLSIYFNVVIAVIGYWSWRHHVQEKNPQQGCFLRTYQQWEVG